MYVQISSMERNRNVSKNYPYQIIIFTDTHIFQNQYLNMILFNYNRPFVILHQIICLTINKVVKKIVNIIKKITKMYDVWTYCYKCKLY